MSMEGFDERLRTETALRLLDAPTRARLWTLCKSAGSFQDARALLVCLHCIVNPGKLRELVERLVHAWAEGNEGARLAALERVRDLLKQPIDAPVQPSGAKPDLLSVVPDYVHESGAAWSDERKFTLGVDKRLRAASALGVVQFLTDPDVEVVSGDDVRLLCTLPHGTWCQSAEQLFGLVMARFESVQHATDARSRSIRHKASKFIAMWMSRFPGDFTDAMRSRAQAALGLRARPRALILSRGEMMRAGWDPLALQVATAAIWCFIACVRTRYRAVPRELLRVIVARALHDRVAWERCPTVASQRYWRPDHVRALFPQGAASTLAWVASKRYTVNAIAGAFNKIAWQLVQRTNIRRVFASPAQRRAFSYVAFWNQIVRCVQISTLLQTSMAGQCAALRKWYEVIDALVELGDFGQSAAIYSAVNTVVLRRRNANSASVTKDFAHVEALFTPARSYQALRQRMAECRTVYFPQISMPMTDMLFIEEGNAALCDGLPNMRKAIAAGRVVEALVTQLELHVPVPLSPLEEEIVALLFGTCAEEDDQAFESISTLRPRPEND